VAVRGFFRREWPLPARGGGEPIQLPAGVDWRIWRVVTDRRIPDGLTEILESWSIVDLREANGVLDAIDAAETRARRPKD
jgi:hypothetical protein